MHRVNLHGSSQRCASVPQSCSRSLAELPRPEKLARYGSSALSAVQHPTLLVGKQSVALALIRQCYTTIRAPIAGLSSFATKHDGSYIGEGENSMLTYVAAIDPIWVKFSVSENQWLRLQEEGKAGRLVVHRTMLSMWRS